MNMKSFPAKQRVPGYVRDRFHDSNGRSSLGSYHNVRFYNQQPPHNYLLPKKIISKFNPPKQHHQQQQRYRYPPSNPSNPNAGHSSSLSCYVCNKSFPSSQFLYSHMMRLHPERGMKGVLPPQQTPVTKSVVPSHSQSSSERNKKGVLPPQQSPVMNSVVDPSHSRSSNERSMKGLLPPQQGPVLKFVMPSQSQSLNERDVKDVLQPPRAPISPTTKSVLTSPSGSSSASESSDVTESNSGPAKPLLSWGKKDRRGRTNNPCSCACTSNVAIASLQKPMEATTTSSTSIPSSRNTVIANEQNPNKRSSTTGNESGLIENKMMKMTMTKKYECNICHKDFDTGQALGGHKSSSACKAVREPKLLASAVDHDPPQLVVSTTENTIMDGVVVRMLTTKKTVYDDIEEGEIVEDGEITDEEGTQGNQPRSRAIFGFDLNELPPEE